MRTQQSCKLFFVVVLFSLISPSPHSYILLPKLGRFPRLVKSFLLLMSIYSLARATSNLFLLITHNFQVVWPAQRLAPCCVCSEECCDCLLFIYLFTYTSLHPCFRKPHFLCFLWIIRALPECWKLVFCRDRVLNCMHTHTTGGSASSQCKHAA